MTVPPTIAPVPSRFVVPVRKRDVELGTSFMVMPFRLTVRVIILAIITITLDHLLQEQYVHLPKYLRMSADDARTVLATLAGGSITVVALVVSLMMVVLSLVAANFGPRIILNFVRRPTTQTAIGSFVAVFVYSLVTLATVFSGSGDDFAPVISTWTAVVIVLLATALLVLFIEDISRSIQVGNMLSEIATDLTAAIGRQRALARRAASSTAVAVDTADWVAVNSRFTGYVQRIDFDALVELGRRNDCIIRLEHRSGAFLNTGWPMAMVSARLSSGDEDLLRAAIVRGSHRTMEQDLEYAIAQYVEIALRAMSPAVNDPATTISCIDWIGDSLLALAEEPIGIAAFADASGTTRVLVPANSLCRVIAAGFNEIRQHGADSPAVAIRLLLTIAKVVPAVRERDALEELASQAEAVTLAATAATVVQRDRDDILSARARVTRALAAANPDGQGRVVDP